MKDYTAAALAGQTDNAAKIYYGMQPIRELRRRWVLDPWASTGLCPISTIKVWPSQLGMTGGPVPHGLPGFSAEQQEKLAAELVAVGLIDK